jgi:branched-chain amino acid transport system permease protein
LTLLVTMLVIGGLGTQTGPIVGTVLLTVISSRLEQYPEIRLILLGVILLLIILLMPRGIVPLAAGLRRRIARWVAEDSRDDGGETPDEPWSADADRTDVGQPVRE